MQNPFVYGEVVSAATFVNRVVELDRLVGDLTSGQKVFLISPRRYGKSSLIRQALLALGRTGTLTVEVTVSSFSSYVAFLEGYARALMAAETKWDRARSWLSDAIRSARAEVRYVPDPTLTTPGSGSLSVSFPTVRSDRDVSRLAQEVFALPARLAAARKRKVVVALDEFQAIGGFNGGSVEHAMRAAIQHQREVGYVFAGSEPSLMERMLTPKRPFYKAGPVMRLEKIPADEFAEFLEARFARSGIRPEHGLGLAIVELAGNLPYDVQRLAHETWDEVRVGSRKKATFDDLHQALKRLLVEQETMFEAMWQRLTLPQRAVLRAVVLEEGHELLSADARTRHRLGGASTVQAALGALRRDDVISREGDRYVVVDSLLREWVARRTF
jgi:AAA+ ATPase superfamily predicted ATPase